MVEAIDRYGKYLKFPSYHKLRVPMLNMELDHTHKMLKSNKEIHEKYDCSIILDGWTDTRNKTLIFV